MSLISVIIPVLNEEALIEDAIRLLPLNDARVELIIADGWSNDRTASIISGFSANNKRLIMSRPGRGRQMNDGARYANGDILLFLHADAKLKKGGIDTLLKAMEDPMIIGGAFGLAIDSRSPFLCLVALLTNIRSIIFKFPYGDQGIFVRRSVFEEIGGYQDIPVMEDIEFIIRLKKRGKIKILKEKVVVSSRRWDKEGPVYTTFRNWILASLYLMGVPPARLYKWYKNIR